MSRPRSSEPEDLAGPQARSAGQSARLRRLPEGSLGMGVATIWLSFIVLLPLTAVLIKSFEDGSGSFWDAITSEGAISSLTLTLGISVIVTIINTILGTLIAWVLVRDEFRGKRIINALIDLPFAIPTIVASIVLVALYGAQSPVGINIVNTRPIIVIALLFVTLPFVIRSIQPVLLEAEREVEQAAATLGANNRTIFLRVVLPTIAPALISGAGLAFARAIGEYGSVVLVSASINNLVTSQYIVNRIESDDLQGAAASSMLLLLVAFVVLVALRFFSQWTARHHES